MGSLGTSRRMWSKNLVVADLETPVLDRCSSAPSIALLTPSRAAAAAFGGIEAEALAVEAEVHLPTVEKRTPHGTRAELFGDVTPRSVSDPLMAEDVEITPAYMEETEESYLARLAYFNSFGRKKRPSSMSSLRKREPVSLMDLFESGKLGRSGCWLRRPSKQLEEARSRAGSTCSTRSRSPSLASSMDLGSEDLTESRRSSAASVPPSEDFTGPARSSLSPPVKDRFPSKSSTLKLPPLASR